MLEQDKSGKLLTGDDVLTTFPELKRRNDIGIILFAHKLWMAVRFCNTLSHRHSAGWEDLEQPDALATARDDVVSVASQPTAGAMLAMIKAVMRPSIRSASEAGWRACRICEP